MLDALGADHERLILSHMRPKLAADGAKLLRRRDHHEEVAGGNFAELGGGLDGRVERDSRQIERVPVRLVDLGDGLGLIGPQDHVAAGAARAHGKRRPPGASPDNTDALQSHVPAATVAAACHTGKKQPPSWRRKPISKSA